MTRGRPYAPRGRSSGGGRGGSWNYSGGSSRGGSYPLRGSGGGSARGGNRNFSNYSSNFSNSATNSSSSSDYRFQSTSTPRSGSEFKRPYRMDYNNYRDNYKSPERKHQRIEAPKLRHETSATTNTYGGYNNRYNDSATVSSSYADGKRHFSGGDRHHNISSSGAVSSSLSSTLHLAPHSTIRRDDYYHRRNISTGLDTQSMSQHSMNFSGGGYNSGYSSRGRRSSFIASSTQFNSRPLQRDFRDPLTRSVRRRPPIDTIQRSSRPLRGGGVGGRRGVLESSSYSIRRRVIPSRTYTTRPATNTSADHARRLIKSKMRSEIAARQERESKTSPTKTENLDEKKETESKVVEKTESAEVKSEEKKEEEKPAPLEDSSKDKDDAMEEEEEKIEKPTKHSSNYIKLHCPHCNLRISTFRHYESHLQSRMHAASMRRVSFKQRVILTKMRMNQRQAQNELEKSEEDLSTRTNFCALCKLNYKQRKGVHQSSEAHNNMSKFLMPYCEICSVSFKSPMGYESHCCSIEHLKRKQRIENSNSNNSDPEEENWDNFTTLDSVGVEGDGSDEEVTSDSPSKKKTDDKDEEGASTEKDNRDRAKETTKDHVEKEKSSSSSSSMNIGAGEIRKVEAYYCDLCQLYVCRGTDQSVIDSVIRRHCKQRTHMRRYIRYKENKKIEKHAKNLQRKEIEEKEKKTINTESIDLKVEDKEKVVTEEVAPPETTAPEDKGKEDGRPQVVDSKEAKSKPDVEEKTEKDDTKADGVAAEISNVDDEERDDKLWADVVKDLDDFLAEEEEIGNKSTDEDEDLNGERYDRFKYSSEKNGEMQEEKDVLEEDSLVATNEEKEIETNTESK